MRNNYHRKILLILMLLFTFVSVNQIAAAYELTARSFGMGGAFSAIAEDIETVLYNPAGLANIGTISINGSTGITAYNVDELTELRNVEDNIGNDGVQYILEDITDNAGMRGQVFFGASLSKLALAYNIEDRLNVDYDKLLYSNEILSEGIVSFANTLVEPPFDLGTLSYGLNFKLINISREKYDVENNIETRTKGNGYGLDLGAQAKLTDNLRLACVVEDLLVSDIRLDGEKRSYQYEDSSWKNELIDSSYTEESEQLNTNVRIGAAFRVPVIGLTLACDIDDFFADDSQIYHFGLEKNLFFNALSIRGGKITGGELDYTTLGLGLNLSAFNLDLAFGRNDKDGNLTALLSTGIDF